MGPPATSHFHVMADAPSGLQPVSLPKPVSRTPTFLALLAKRDLLLMIQVYIILLTVLSFPVRGIVKFVYFRTLTL